MSCVGQQFIRLDASLFSSPIWNLWIFQKLKQPEAEALVRAGRRCHFKTGQTLFMQGMPGNNVFLFMAGGAKITRVSEKGKELILDIRRAGDFLGEHILNDDYNYPLMATCLDGTLALVFSRDVFEQLLMEHPNIGLEVIKNLSRRIGWLTSQAEILATSDLKERLYRVLSMLGREYGERKQRQTVIQFLLTHEELSFLVGAHRVSVTRAMKELRDSGLIIQKGRTLTLMNDE